MVLNTHRFHVDACILHRQLNEREHFRRIKVVYVRTQHIIYRAYVVPRLAARSKRAASYSRRFASNSRAGRLHPGKRCSGHTRSLIPIRLPEDNRLRQYWRTPRCRRSLNSAAYCCCASYSAENCADGHFLYIRVKVDIFRAATFLRFSFSDLHTFFYVCVFSFFHFFHPSTVGIYFFPVHIFNNIHSH